MLMNSFKLFDPENKGTIHKDELKEILIEMGKPEERLTEHEVNLV